MAKRLVWQTNVNLTQRNVYIFASGFGGFYLLITGLLFVVALNYQNNSVYAFCFLLISVFVSSILLTFNNIYGLQLSRKGKVVAIVGESVPVKVVVSAGRRTRFGIEIGFDRLSLIPHIDSNNVGIKNIVTQWSAAGVHQLPPIKVLSVYPLGLFKAWSWVGISGQCFIAPVPFKVSSIKRLCGMGDAQGAELGRDDDELHLREYRDGDAMRDIYWRRAATGGQLVSKEAVPLQGGVQQDRLLHYQFSDATGHHERLADLCFWVLECRRQQQPVGLQLPNVVINVGEGEAHIQRCLIALAEAV